jgi:ketose-bisphosphate aldolase
MPLESIARLMAESASGGYAVGYFESWNLASLQGVLDAAEQTRAPVIVGFNGEFLSLPHRLTSERLALYGALGRAAAVSSTVPVGLIFNECSDDVRTAEAIEAGFNLVMPADPDCPYEAYVQRVRQIVAQAHARDVAVEAELGELPCGSGDHPGAAACLTDPHQAARFVHETGVDLLAVSVGNVHIQLRGEVELDLEHLATIRAQVAVPLVLHGGTGIARHSLREAIGLGVAKVNYGTYLKQRYLTAIRTRLTDEDAARSADGANPHELLGMGGARDLLVAGRIAVRDAVLERIDTLGCCGRAW